MGKYSSTDEYTLEIMGKYSYTDEYPLCKPWASIRLNEYPRKNMGASSSLWTSDTVSETWGEYALKSCLNSL